MKKISISLILLLSILFGVTGCAEQKSQDPLAGTSWTAVDDGSCWVFGEDQTFH